MRHHIGSHTYGNTAGSIDQQLGIRVGRTVGSLQGIIKIELKIDGVFFDILEHSFG